jgi:hypothetical protein
VLEVLRGLLDSWIVTGAWAAIVVACLAVLVTDLRGVAREAHDEAGG